MTLQADSDARQRRISRLMIFFALAYFTEGVGLVQNGLIYQPLTYYLKQVSHWTPLQVTAMMTVTWLPWIIKPLYGIVSDFLPLFGYRRRIYLMLANLLASIAFLFMARAVSPNALVFFVMLTAYGMASASTLYGALLVENGQEFAASGLFVNQQWLWLNIAQVGTALLGGALIEYFPPDSALHIAALVSMVMPLGVAAAAPFLVEEKRAPISMEGFHKAPSALRGTFAQKELYLLAAFLFVYQLNPGVGQTTAFYYYLTDHMKFSQGFIGVMSSVIAGGWIIGALLYRRYLKHVSSRHLLNLSIAAGIVANLAYFFLAGQVSAVWISALAGGAFAVSYVACISIAADFCPPGAEGFAFAILMSVNNIATPVADNAGSYLYEYVFHGKLEPLILISAAITAIGFVLVPMLRLGDKKQGEAVRRVAETAP